MSLRLSRFVHRLPLDDGRVLVVHAVSHLRLVIDREFAQVLDCFTAPQDLETAGAAAEALAALVERGVLTDKSPEVELSDMAAELAVFHDRDPQEMVRRFRREAREGGEPYWAAGQALGLDDFAGHKARLDVLLFGDCDIQMESDFLRREAARRGIDLRVAATFPDDLRFAGERRHDVILIGALRARRLIAGALAADAQEPPFSAFINQARDMVEGLRTQTSAPILIDNLPEPTVQPLGFADRGLYGHRNRFRLANVSLAAMAEEYADVHVVDVAATLAAVGSERLLDDAHVDFTHFGSPGWLLQRPPGEMAAVHGLFPDLAPLAGAVGSDPYGREAVMAKAHVDALMVVTGLQRKKCVIVDLDGLLWPGVLAETGAPFAWDPDVSGPFSYVGLYFGLHEALLSLKRRGVLLACVSKNDEATVRALWTYADHYPRERLLTPADFVTWRVNWNDKVENILSIAAELGFALGDFLFLDDTPIERDRVRQRLPEVEVWGEDPFALRRRLLSDPRLQPARLTAESAARTQATQAQIARQHAHAASLDEAGFIASLNVQVRVERPAPGADLERVAELFRRTTQFNTTGARFAVAELEQLLSRPDADLFSLQVSDRFGDHGLAGAAVICEGEIVGLALSCRVLGLGVEHRFLQSIISALQGDHAMLTARIIETSRNIPVRHLYRDNGFVLGEDQIWRRALR
jgi:FkbH-like protein